MNRRILVLAAAALLAGCDLFDPPVPTTITVAPATVSLDAVGAQAPR